VSGTLTISTENLSTGSERRDSDVQEMLGNTITVALADVPLVDGSISADVTINDVTVPVAFDITVSETDGAYSVSGSARINMEEDFNIDAPSVLDLYSVDPVTELSFEVTLN